MRNHSETPASPKMFADLERQIVLGRSTAFYIYIFLLYDVGNTMDIFLVLYASYYDDRPRSLSLEKN